MRATLSIIVFVAALANSAHADYLADRARPLVEAMHAEIRAIHLGRYTAQGRWNEILDETLYLAAPKGRWSPEHPVWPAAKASAARALREASVVNLREKTGAWIREVLAERYSSLEPDEAARAVAFYESPGGIVFRDFREKYLAENAYGLPFVIETESRATMQKDLAAAKQRLLDLPDEQTQAVYDFNHSKTGEFLMGVENNIVADVVGNIMRSELSSLLIRERGEAVVRRIRAEVPKMPPASRKDYLGTVTMRADHGLDVAIEYHEGFRLAGTYKLFYDSREPEWQDVTRGIPGIAPGETRFLYRDPDGRLSDAP